MSSDASRVAVHLYESQRLPIICLHNTPAAYVKVPVYVAPAIEGEFGRHTIASCHCRLSHLKLWQFAFPPSAQLISGLWRCTRIHIFSPLFDLRTMEKRLKKKRKTHVKNMYTSTFSVAYDGFCLMSATLLGNGNSNGDGRAGCVSLAILKDLVIQKHEARIIRRMLFRHSQPLFPIMKY